MHCAEIRQKFVDYYQHLGFQFLPRAPMMHPSIPMSFVMGAEFWRIRRYCLTKVLASYMLKMPNQTRLLRLQDSDAIEKIREGGTYYASSNI